MRSATILLLVAAIAAACDKGTKAPEPGKGVHVVPATYGEHSNAPPETRSKCEFDTELTEEVTEASAAVAGVAGKQLTLVITRMRGAEPAWEGEISVIVEGVLEDDGAQLGNFRVQRRALGGVGGGMRGVCEGLDDIAELMAEDIAGWLASPKEDSELGG